MIRSFPFFIHRATHDFARLSQFYIISTRIWTCCLVHSFYHTSLCKRNPQTSAFEGLLHSISNKRRGQLHPWLPCLWVTCPKPCPPSLVRHSYLNHTCRVDAHPTTSAAHVHTRTHSFATIHLLSLSPTSHRYIYLSFALRDRFHWYFTCYSFFFAVITTQTVTPTSVIDNTSIVPPHTQPNGVLVTMVL